MVQNLERSSKVSFDNATMEAKQKTHVKTNTLNIYGLILTILSVTVALTYLQTVLVPFVLALLLFFMISPGVDWLQSRARIPRLLSVTTIIFMGISFAAVLLLLISHSLNQFFDIASTYQERMSDLLLWISSLGKKWNLNFEIEPLKEYIDMPEVFQLIRRLTKRFMGIMGNLFLVAIILVFLITGSSQATKVPKFMTELREQVSIYVWCKFIIATITGTLVGLALAILGMDLALMFGVLTFLLEFIPNIGSIVALFLPLPIALLKFGFGWNFLLILLVPALIQLVIGGYIDPKITGSKLDLHPVSILLFLIFWGIVWGLPGMLLAVPITAILKLIFEYFPKTQPLANLLAGRISQ